MINAVVDALAHLGVTDIEMPATPERVWRAIQEAKHDPAAFDYEVAESVEHALALLGERADAKLLAGGHSLLPALKLRFARPSMLVDIGRLGELAYVRDDGDAWRSARSRGTRPSHARPAAAGALPDRRRHGRRWSATRRCATAARSAGRSPTATRRPTCRR